MGGPGTTRIGIHKSSPNAIMGIGFAHEVSVRKALGDDVLEEMLDGQAAGLGFGSELGFEFGLEVKLDHCGCPLWVILA